MSYYKSCYENCIRFILFYNQKELENSFTKLYSHFMRPDNQVMNLYEEF